MHSCAKLHRRRSSKLTSNSKFYHYFFLLIQEWCPYSNEKYWTEKILNEDIWMYYCNFLVQTNIEYIRWNITKNSFRKILLACVGDASNVTRRLLINCLAISKCNARKDKKRTRSIQLHPSRVAFSYLKM